MLVFTPRMRNSCRQRSMRRDGIDKVAAPGGDLHQQRIVERRDHRAGERRAGVEPNAHAARRAVVRRCGRSRAETCWRDLRSSRGTEWRSRAFGSLLLTARPISGSASGMPCATRIWRLDDVDAGDFFGDGVLDLDARIDFDEVELVGVGIDQELDRAGVLVVHRAADRRAPHRRSASRRSAIEIGRRRDLDHLLMPPLHRAIALEQVHQVAVLVAQQLHFDVPGALDELFDEDVAAAEGGQATRAAPASELAASSLGFVDHAHAAAAAPLGRLEHHRIAELLGQLVRLRPALLSGLALPASTGTPACCGDVAGRRSCRPAAPAISTRRADEDDARLAGRPGRSSGFSDRKP